MYELFPKILLWLGLTGLTFWFWQRMRSSQRPLRASYWLVGLLGVTFLLRWVYVLDVERSVDTSVWMASTLAVGSYPDKLWIWLNYSDSRPLTVLPLMLSNALGFRITYSFTEYLGLVLVLGALTFLYRTFRLHLEPAESLLLTATACLFWSTTWFKDYVAYNSELVSIAALSVPVWGYFRYRASPEKNTGLLVLNGLVLGGLPYVKFQNVPMVLVLGAFLSFELLRRRRFGQMALLVGCGILPTLLIVGYYGARNQIDVFWKDYFWQYFYYSYTNDFSSLPSSQRFTPWRIARFVYAGSWQSGGYFTGLTGVVAAVGIYWYKNRKAAPTDWLPVVFGVLFWLAGLYAALQAGNFFQHYLIFYLFGLLVLTGVALSTVPVAQRRMLLTALLMVAWLQGSANLLFRRPIASAYSSGHQQIVSLIQRLSKPGESLLVWGYATQLYAYSNRPPAYYRVLTYWLYHPTSSLHRYRIEQFYRQMEQRKPRLFVDIQQASLSLDGREEYRVPRYPDVYGYLQAHYTYVGEEAGARFYRRK